MNHVSTTPPPRVRRWRFSDPLAFAAEARLEYGDLFELAVGPRRFLMVSHPAYAEEIMVRQKANFIKPSASPWGDILVPVLGDGLVTVADGPEWRRQRRMMQPMFHRRAIEAIGVEMVAAAERMLNRWAALPDGVVVDIDHEMMRTTMDIVTRAMFSANVLDQADAVGNAINDALEEAYRRRRPLTPPLWLPTPGNLRLRRAVKAIDAYIYGLIDARRGRETDHADLLSLLMLAEDAETGERLTRRQVRDQVTTIFGAGHETTSHALAWTLYLLATHPNELAALQRDVDTILGDRLPAAADLEALPRLRWVFEEGMRLFPPIPLIPRYVKARADIGPFTVEPGALAAIVVRNIHHHPEQWPEPERFLPERMARPNPARHRLALMPFGAGHRMCIGNHMAMLEGQLLLAVVVQRYTITRPEDAPPIRPELAVTLRPGGGLPLRLSRRMLAPAEAATPAANAG